MPPPQASDRFYTLLQQYQLLLLQAGRRLWRDVLPGDLDGSWARVAPQMVAFTAGAQLAAATAATVYVPAVLDETGQQAPAEARVRPQAFSGVAFDGRSLATLLEGGVRTAKSYIAEGSDGGDALAQGLRWLETALPTIVTDAARDVTAAEIAVRPRLQWVRVVNPPCCSRCAVLAGKVYGWNAKFLRHPRCDCTALPVTVANAHSYLTDPAKLVEQGLVKDLTPGQRQRLGDGANLTQVLNESRNAWRQRMAVERKAAKARGPQTWGTASAAPLPPGGIGDFLSHLTSRVDALNALKAHGIAA